jgi:GT2 family glycosyltransferase
MISVIVCSIDDARLGQIERMYRHALKGVEMEFIGVKSPVSLAAGYNDAAARSKGEILLFSHDDLYVLRMGLAATIQKALATYDLLGVAGTTRLVNAKWTSAGPPHLFGQIAHQLQANQPFRVNIYCAPTRTVGHIQAIDGVFMAARRALWEKNPFDPIAFDGFHLYDIDFSYSAFRAGAKICVCNDISLVHHSIGQFSADAWKKYAERFMQKYGEFLPPHKERFFQWSGHFVDTAEEALAIMTPGYWDD